MIVVANNTTRSRVNAVMSAIEAEVGREIRYVLMDSEEFKYRMEMLDRFLTDFFEGPHEEVINKVAGLKRLILNAKK